MFLSILRPFVPLRLERVIVGGELVREFVHVVITHMHHVVGDLLWIRCVFIHAKSHQSLIWSSYQIKWLYPSPTVNVNAKGLDARDENVNTKIKFAAVDQVRQIHVPGKMGLVIPGRMGSIGAIRCVVSTFAPSVLLCERSGYRGLSWSKRYLVLGCFLKLLINLRNIIELVVRVVLLLHTLEYWHWCFCTEHF